MVAPRCVSLRSVPFLTFLAPTWAQILWFSYIKAIIQEDTNAGSTVSKEIIPNTEISITKVNIFGSNAFLLSFGFSWTVAVFSTRLESCLWCATEFSQEFRKKRD
jgi:hypothetical protein